MAKKKGLYVELPDELIKYLNDIINSEEQKKYSKAFVVSTAIKYFKGLDPSEQKSILNGDNLPSLFDKLIKIIDTNNWAEHGFQKGRYTWALETYINLKNQIENLTTSDNPDLLIPFTKFRIAFCLLEIARELRKEAISEENEYKKQSETGKKSYKSKWKQIYAEIKNAINASLRYYDTIENHPVSIYNKSCTHGYLCLVLIEEALGKNNIDNITGKKIENVSDLNKEWETIGKLWREHCTKELEEEVMKHSDNAMDYLRKLPIQKKATQEAFPHPKANHFLIQLSLKDDDLIFLRKDNETQKLFNRWNQGQNTSMLSDYMKLKKMLNL